MKNLATLWVLAAALAAPAAQAQDEHHGAYLVAALGRSHINYDCNYYLSCRSATPITGKLIAGYRFDFFSSEIWVADFGKSDISDTFRRADLRLRAIGLNGAWSLHFGDSWRGLLRAGVAQVTHERTDDGRRVAYAGSVGLGAVLDLTPTVGAEIAWDFTRAEGNNVSTSLIHLVSAGLRLKF